MFWQNIFGGLTHVVKDIHLITARHITKFTCHVLGFPHGSHCEIFTRFLTLLFVCLQVNPDKYKSIGNGFRVTVREDGARGLAKGWAPTFIGYSMQGLCKFGFYEVFKIFYSDMLGEVRPAIIELFIVFYYFCNEQFI